MPNAAVSEELSMSMGISVDRSSLPCAMSGRDSGEVGASPRHPPNANVDDKSANAMPVQRKKSTIDERPASKKKRISY